MGKNTLDYVNIGKRIRAARKKKGISQLELALRVDLTPAHMSHIETGNTKPALPTIVSIANALSVSVDDLLCDNLEKVKAVYDQKIAEELSDCDAAELEVFLQIIQSTKTVIRKVRKVEQIDD